MPKKRPAPVTFDEWLGKIVENRMSNRGYTQDSLATAVGIPTTNLGRSIRGKRPLTVTELHRLAGTLSTTATSIAEEALREYGGLEKLIAAHAAMSEDALTVDPADNVTYIGRQYEVPEHVAADKKPRRGPKD